MTDATPKTLSPAVVTEVCARCNGKRRVYDPNGGVYPETMGCPVCNPDFPDLASPERPVEREVLAKAIDPAAWDDGLYAEPGGRGQLWAQDAARKAADRVSAILSELSGRSGV